MAKSLLVTDSTGTLRWNTPDSLPPPELERAYAQAQNRAMEMRWAFEPYEYWVVLVICFFLARELGRQPSRWFAFLPMILFARLAGMGDWLGVFAVVLAGYWFARGKRASSGQQPLRWGVATFVGCVVAFTLVSAVWWILFPQPYVEMFFITGFLGRSYATLVLGALIATLAFRGVWPMFGGVGDSAFRLAGGVVLSTFQVFTLRGRYRVFAAIPILFVAGVVWWLWRIIHPHVAPLLTYAGGMVRLFFAQVGASLR